MLTNKFNFSYRHWMLDRALSQNEAYRRFECVLVSYRLPFLKHCFILCHEGHLEDSRKLTTFYFAQASELAEQSVGDPNAFVLIASGQSVRRRPNLHAHVFVVETRFQKALVYLILGLKNLALAIGAAI